MNQPVVLPLTMDRPPNKYARGRPGSWPALVVYWSGGPCVRPSRGDLGVGDEAVQLAVSHEGAAVDAG